MDHNDYEKIIHTVPATGIFIIREDNHEILYYNEQVRKTTPHVHTGMPCQKPGNHTCANCPVFTIGDGQEYQTLCYHTPFGEMADIKATRIKWKDQIPAFIVTISPHVQTISHSYHEILRVNLTRDHYDIVRMRPEDQAIGCGTDTFSGWLGQLIYSGTIHPDDMNNFIAFTHPDHLKNGLEDGQEVLTCCYRLRCGEDFRWQMMEVVRDKDYSAEDLLILLYIKDVHDILQNSLELDDTSMRIQEVIRTLGQQNFGIYSIDLDTGEANLVRENGHTHTGWKSWTVQWDEIMDSRLIHRLHPADREKFFQEFSLEGLRRTKDTSVQKTDMLCQWKGEEDHEYRYMAVIAYFDQQHGAKNHTILALQNVDKRVRQEHMLSLRDMQLAAILKSRYSVMTTVYPENGQCEQVWINEDSKMQNIRTDHYHQYFRRTLETIVHPDDANAFQQVMGPEHLYQKAASTRDYEEEICRYRVAGTSLHWVEQHVIYARQGKRISVNILGRDITREKLEEEIRQKGEQEQADIIRTLGDMFFAIYYADLEQDTFRSVTQLQEVEKALDGRVDYATGMRIYAQNFVHPDDRAEYLHTLSIENLRKTLNKKQPFVTIAYRKLPQTPQAGPEAYGWIRGTAIMSQTDAEGRARSIVYAAQDVTESKRKEMREHLALQAACEAADQANASRREFLSSMSHNVLTPMNGILGMLNIAGEHLHEPERVKTYLEKASSSSYQLLAMLNELLDMSQIKSGSLHLQSESFRLSDLMQHVASVIGPDLTKKGLRLIFHPVQVEHENVIGDKTRLRQIFLNILGNSVNYTPSGGTVEMSVKEHPSKERGCRSYHFIFRDNGIGMEETFLQHLFEPFSRAPQPDDNQTDGVGLGMTIAQNIARMMGGSISVKSHPGQGSQFTVTIILKLQQPALRPSQPPETVLQTAPPTPDFQGYKILLVEDNELNQEIAMELIGEIGAMVECAGDGRLGLQRFAEMPEGYYDLILMDIQMPVMNGFEATRAIRKLPRADAASIPIIALSANVSTDDIAAAREAGMNEHLAKPLDIPHLMELMIGLKSDKTH